MSQPEPATVAMASNEAVTITNQLMISAVIFLFMVVVFVFFLYLYAKNYMTRSRRSLLVFASNSDRQNPAAAGQGLDTQVLKSLPIKVFGATEFKNGLECAVCLSELSQGEEARILPRCGHGFHVDCIDMWFHSHSTCPLCRTPVVLGEGELSSEAGSTNLANLPTNIEGRVRNGVVGNQEGSSSSLVIDIPRRAIMDQDIVSPLPTSKFPAEEMKSPTPKSTTRLKSLKRLLSRGKMVVGSSSSPRGGDIEQGIIGEGSSTLNPVN